MTEAAGAQATAALWAAGLLLWIASAIAWRRWRAKPIFATRRADARFVGRWACARLGTGVSARLGTARNCMQVQVTTTDLRLHPHFPFTLGFMPEVYGLDQVVPLQSIRSAVILGGAAHKAVEVKYGAAGEDEQVLQLLLNDGEGFIRALQRA